MDWKGIKGIVMRDIPMKRYTSMKVGGPARFLVYPTGVSDLGAALKRLSGEGIKARILGNGTNVIVHDRGLDEALIRITRMGHLRYAKAGERVAVEVSGGVSLTRLIRENARRGLSGLEKLYSIPGTVGGAIKMNAGSFGQSVSDGLAEARVMDDRGVESAIGKGDAFGYRKSPVKPSECVVDAQFLLEKRDESEILRDMDYVCQERRKRHPWEYPSAGSVFKKAGDEPAWRLIERAGLKGLRVGGAQVSEKHANFIVNLGWATAADIKTLIERIKKEVFEKTGATLEEEVEFWGFDA